MSAQAWEDHLRTTRKYLDRLSGDKGENDERIARLEVEKDLVIRALGGALARMVTSMVTNFLPLTSRSPRNLRPTAHPVRFMENSAPNQGTAPVPRRYAKHLALFGSIVDASTHAHQFLGALQK